MIIIKIQMREYLMGGKEKMEILKILTNEN
jgi:hypothetical protein